MSLYKETLMKHFRNPEFKFESQTSISQDGVNPSCGDNITIFTDISDGKIDAISYTGNGCAISMASADIMCMIIRNQENPIKIINDFQEMITGEAIDFKDNLEILNVFKEMQDFPARRSCALLPWNTLEKVLSSI